MKDIIRCSWPIWTDVRSPVRHGQMFPGNLPVSLKDEQMSGYGSLLSTNEFRRSHNLCA